MEHNDKCFVAVVVNDNEYASGYIKVIKLCVGKYHRDRKDKKYE